MPNFALASLVAVHLLWLAGLAHSAELTLDAVNSAKFDPGARSSRGTSAVMLRAQILLDRAHFSPGVIDGRPGENTERALKAFEEARSLRPDGRLDAELWRELTKDAEPALVTYEITAADVKGPFAEKIPDKLEAMAKLDRIAYTSPAELLAEKFHMDEDLLRRLNEGADFRKAGTKIVVANVRGSAPRGEVVRVEADKKREAVIAFDADERVIAYYPATVGSRSLPSPSGRTEVRSVASNPKYYYRPDLGFRNGPKERLTIAAGPNNPVGTTWIDLDREGYGLHGTAEPAQVGKESSHGCVRLTNWDAEELGRLVKRGIPVHFKP